jgi:peptide/nickel transport system permease protein
MNFFLVRRSLQGALSLILVIVAVFFMARVTGSPAHFYLPTEATPQQIAEFEQVHGFDQPVIIQFFNFLQGIVRLDIGNSLRFGRPAIDVVLEAFPTTLLLAAITMPIVLLVGIVTGSLAAVRPNGIFDRISSWMSLVGASAPDFWFGLVGIIVFAVTLRLVPTSGTGTPLHWVLPIAVLSFRPIGVMSQVARTSMIASLSSAYVKTAKAKGVSSTSIVFVHALRNALLPIITVAGDLLAGMINGAVIVETIFGFPGLGKLMIDSITMRDFSTLQAGVLIVSIVVFALNILIDLLYSAVDPRVRLN